MTIENEEQRLSEAKNASVSVFGYELIRDVLIGDLLGSDAGDVLYWGGKALARRFPCTDTEELSAFFQEAGWGMIYLIKETKNERLYRLSGGMTERRFNVQTNPSFTLESGFVAEQMSAHFDREAEAICQLHKKSKHVDITVKWE
ncbi:YslB family protein [Domibacillus sp. A3M-37]|uniref:YslB family protein n=1 Tax=Domibacillus TaxID=1433999 RepID=UPI0006987DC2|nr:MULTISPECIES: YslB family protein [Domibacillus]MCP3762530.1 YslB family protein [Domibacillus sp. A3M-37]